MRVEIDAFTIHMLQRRYIYIYVCVCSSTYWVQASRSTHTAHHTHTLARTRLHYFLVPKHMSEQISESCMCVPDACLHAISERHVNRHIPNLQPCTSTYILCAIHTPYYDDQFSFFPFFFRFVCFLVMLQLCTDVPSAHCSVFSVQPMVECRSRHPENRSTKCVNMNTKFLRDVD